MWPFIGVYLVIISAMPWWSRSGQNNKSKILPVSCCEIAAPTSNRLLSSEVQSLGRLPLSCRIELHEDSQRCFQKIVFPTTQQFLGSKSQHRDKDLDLPSSGLSEYDLLFQFTEDRLYPQ